MDPSNFYFAYGADVNPGEPGTRAYLPDCEAVFCGVPGSSGGTLHFQPRKGRVLSGLLYEGSGADLHLDREDEHIATHAVLTPDGGVIRARLRTPKPGHRCSRATPEKAYLERLRRCRDEAGLDMHWLSPSAGASRAPTFNRLFVYGTLMRGECRFGILEDDCGISDIALASAPGRLLDLGAYPGMVSPHDPGQRVAGEVATLQDPESAFNILDGVEDFLGWNQQASLYERVLVSARLEEGREVVVWTYRLAAVTSGASPIAGGDWRASRGRPEIGK